MKAAFLRSGITTTHFVPSRTLSGIPLSGALKMSFTTFVEAEIRSLSLSPVSAQEESIKPRKIIPILLMLFIILNLTYLRDWVAPDNPQPVESDVILRAEVS